MDLSGKTAAVTEIVRRDRTGRGTDPCRGNRRCTASAIIQARAVVRRTVDVSARGDALDDGEERVTNRWPTRVGGVCVYIYIYTHKRGVNGFHTGWLRRRRRTKVTRTFCWTYHVITL